MRGELLSPGHRAGAGGERPCHCGSGPPAPGLELWEQSCFFPEQTSHKDSFYDHFSNVFPCIWIKCETLKLSGNCYLVVKFCRAVCCRYSPYAQCCLDCISHVPMFAPPAATQLNIAHSEFSWDLLLTQHPKYFQTMCHLCPKLYY